MAAQTLFRKVSRKNGRWFCKPLFLMNHLSMERIGKLEQTGYFLQLGVYSSVIEAICTQFDSDELHKKCGKSGVFRIGFFRVVGNKLETNCIEKS